MLLSRSTEEGELERQEQEMLYKVFDFADKEVSAVMVPRPEVVALSIEMPPEEALAAVIDSPYTRYPVYRDSLDEIVGVLHVRDLFSALVDRGIAGVQLEQLLRPGAHRPGDEGPGRAADRVPPHEPAPGGRGRRVRRARGDRHARGPARGDRRRDRGRVRPAGRVDRAARGRPRARPRHLPDRRLQRAVRRLAADRGLPHARRLRLRDARPRARARRRGRARGHPLQGAEVEGSRIERLEVELPPQEPNEERLEAAS